MKKKEFAALGRQLTSEIPGATVHGDMIVVMPVGDVLRGLCFEGSSFDAKSFYIWVFCHPLYIPTDCICFTFGDRLRGSISGERWDADSEGLLEELATTIRHQAVPFLSGFDTQQGVVEAARAAAGKHKTVRLYETLSYVLAAAKQVEEAVGAIDVLSGLLDTDIAWQEELGARVTLLREALLKSDEDACELLEAWKAETIRNLGLESLFP